MRKNEAYCGLDLNVDRSEIKMGHEFVNSSRLATGRGKWNHVDMKRSVREVRTGIGRSEGTHTGRGCV